jgi:hypothetical protein
MLSVVPAFAGNGAPSGAHYNLNIIGVPKDKTADMTGNNGHRIFVPLQGKCTINLSIGPFQVMDANCTDGPAAFQLPKPDPGLDGILDYTVWVRVKQARGYANMQACYTDAYGTWCNTDRAITLNKTNYDKFTNVSTNLLTICACTSWNTTDPQNPVCTNWAYKPLFYDEGLDYFWEYDNYGLRLAQFRFYPKVADEGSYLGSGCTGGSQYPDR